jgi:hypothetical protein
MLLVAGEDVVLPKGTTAGEEEGEEAEETKGTLLEEEPMPGARTLDAGTTELRLEVMAVLT